MKRTLLLLLPLAAILLSARCPLPAVKDVLTEYMRACDPDFVLPDSAVVYIVNGVPYKEGDMYLRNVISLQQLNPTFKITVIEDSYELGCSPTFSTIVVIAYEEAKGRRRKWNEAVLAKIREYYAKPSLNYPAFYLNYEEITAGKVPDELDYLKPGRVVDIYTEVCKDNSGTISVEYKE
ncbi:MAG: hypothetical protein WBB45_11345 [Cyclobacteriaceae bacterium]